MLFWEGSTSYSVVTSLQIPLQHRVQDCVQVIERITTQLNSLSDAAYLPMDALEYSSIFAAVDAIYLVLQGAEAATLAEVKQWGL
jgi:hypothetical protein